MALESVEPLAVDVLVTDALAVPVVPRWYTYRDIAAHFKIGLQTVYDWVKKGKVPPPIMMGKYARWSADTFNMICRTGPVAAGNYTPPPSPMAENAKTGGGDWRKPKEIRRPKPAAKKPAAKKPAAKKPAAKKPAAKKPTITKGRRT